MSIDMAVQYMRTMDNNDENETMKQYNKPRKS